MNTKPPYGYRLLKEGEGIQQTDLCFCDKRWSQTINAPYVFRENVFLPHARLIDPGDGWEIVPEGETVKDADEYWTGGMWLDCLNSGMKASADQVLAFRRRKQPTDDGWIKVSERLPEAQQSVFVASQDGWVSACVGGFLKPENIRKCYTHWKPMIYPAPPKPELPPEEKAFLECETAIGPDTHPLVIFKAGWKAAKEAK